MIHTRIIAADTAPPPPPPAALHDPAAVFDEAALVAACRRCEATINRWTFRLIGALCAAWVVGRAFERLF